MVDQGSDKAWLAKGIGLAILFVAAGSTIGMVFDSGFENGWYAALEKPVFQPPGWAFGLVWTILYAMMGFALALVAEAPPSRERTMGLGLFAVQIALNFAWTPIFFEAQMIDLAFVVIVTLLVLVLATAQLFRKVKAVAGWLLVPYLLWLSLASALNYETGRLNPGADSMPLGITGA